MKAFVTSIGEQTTNICCEQLIKFDFISEVILLSEVESWPVKYEKFIHAAEALDEDIIRVDADLIVNNNLAKLWKREKDKKWLMLQAHSYDFYRNNIGITCPVFYRAKAIRLIRLNWDKLNLRRPEATAWRLAEINPHAKTVDDLVGMHGFFQGTAELERAEANKIERKQIDQYDFALARKILNLINSRSL
jgi:hypothetical protein